MDLTEALATLKQLGISSLMIEGGATVIAAFLDLRNASGDLLVDIHIVTVAATIIGPDGIQAAALISRVSSEFN